MTIIDRYILRQFVINFIILMVVVQALFVGIDLIVNLEAYLRAAHGLAGRQHMAYVPALAWVLVDYYGPMCMMLYIYISGIVVVAAMSFTVVNLQRTRELMAVVASGVSLRRVALALVAASFAANLLAVPVQQWVLPPIAYDALRSRSDLVNEGGVARNPVRFMKVNAQGDLLSADSFDILLGTLKGFHLMMRDADGGCLGTITAPLARWDEAGQAWVFDPGGQLAVPPKGMKAVEPKPMSAWPSKASPTVIQANQDGNFARLLSLGDMAELAKLPAISDDFRASLRQAWWSRFAMPLFNTLLTLATLPFFLTRIPLVTPKQGVQAAGLALGCWAAGLLLMSATVLPPFFTVWIPVALLAALGFWRIRRMET